MNLRDQLNTIGWNVDYVEYLGRPFSFYDGKYEMVGTITGLQTSDDGLPMFEISNRVFAGLKVKRIIVLDKTGKAQLITNAKEKEYHWIDGTFTYLGGDRQA